MPADVEAEARRHFDVTMRASNAPMSQAEMVQALKGYDAILPTLGDQFSAEVFAQVTPRAVMLANFGVGYNHIDVAAARAKGLIVSNTPGAVTDATADTAMTLMLMSARRAGEAERLVRSGQWEGWHPTQMLGMHLTGKKVGIVGMGRIGQAIARRCHFGFGMTVAYFTRSPKDLDFDATPYDDLHALAGAVDVLVLAVPGGDETRNLIDAAVLGAMQPHAHLVNISRGDVVDEDALIAALQNGTIGGAGLDVYAREPQVPAALVALDNVVLLPHLGTAALDVRTDMGLMALRNLKAVLIDGQDAPNAV
ncbi:D-glycerate dehydrogenase [Sulfitobacter pseudonitzschiae]|uniref:D-glycerate dehydrogenase n=2 Tax=Pseudosulfitobacter pseudonitzschiae TaxID=1402135 RepID=A0A9Q2NLY2_9RHOB|nr:D-glycerate dehydrogenase [Pseudosulfitobacter pseudonitzschiae]MBM2296909.1 D-glycerate dehydrogenase [Pseudosulfitobacter pseudonitzschiae]MBM2301823.1 D-glycerate dehydrogenase [Pseudosulfitobacter pseudonitzschiae]MBM2311605.1 D-glycerate dehydrogenase [Pseudosulfitobacter pseudonitzschiae]MBM2316519.1 D-glycerate dehydrogenase [Pseudosulfitobacter pseudonitzschiae]